MTNGTVECFFLRFKTVISEISLQFWNRTWELENACTKPLHTERLEYHNYIREGFSIYKRSILGWNGPHTLTNYCCALFRPRSGLKNVAWYLTRQVCITCRISRHFCGQAYILWWIILDVIQASIITTVFNCIDFVVCVIGILWPSPTSFRNISNEYFVITTDQSVFACWNVCTRRGTVLSWN